MELLGATDGFVRRPFLYLGAWYGLFAGLLALAVAALAPWFLRAPVAALVESYGSRFQMKGLDPILALAALLVFLTLLKPIRRILSQSKEA